MVPNIGCIFSIFTECIFIGIWTIAPRRKLPPDENCPPPPVTVYGQLPPEENCPLRLRLEFGSGSGLVLGLGGNQIIALEKNPPRLGLGMV